MKINLQYLSPELQQIANMCSNILDPIESCAQGISVLYRDKAWNILTIIAPSDEDILAQLPEGGTYFTWIN